MLGFLSELSTPFLNCGWLMWHYKKNKKYKRLFNLNNFTIITLYFFTRIVNFTYINWYLYHNNPSFTYYVLPPIGLLTIMNYFWFYKLCKLAIKNI